MAKKAKQELPRLIYVVTSVQPWKSISVNGTPLGTITGKESMIGFLPVFSNKEDALVIAGGDESLIMVMERKS